MIVLFKALVLCLVEYCSVLWSPKTLGLIREVENVQRAYTKKISGMENLGYAERLQKLKLYSLERRRDRFAVIYVWRILNNLSPNLDDSDSKINLSESGRRGLLCSIPPLRNVSGRLQTMREASFAVSGPRLFNCVPREVREYKGSIDGFKRKLDNFLAKIPDQPVILGQQQAVNCNCLNVRVSECRPN